MYVVNVSSKICHMVGMVMMLVSVESLVCVCSSCVFWSCVCCTVTRVFFGNVFVV